MEHTSQTFDLKTLEFYLHCLYCTVYILFNLNVEKSHNEAISVVLHQNVAVTLQLNRLLNAQSLIKAFSIFEDRVKCPYVVIDCLFREFSDVAYAIRLNLFRFLDLFVTFN